jgi:hypothetical protein
MTERNAVFTVLHGGAWLQGSLQALTASSPIDAQHHIEYPDFTLKDSAMNNHPMKKMWLRAALLALLCATLGGCAYSPSKFDLRCGAPEPFDNCGALV